MPILHGAQVQVSVFRGGQGIHSILHISHVRFQTVFTHITSAILLSLDSSLAMADIHIEHVPHEINFGQF